MSKISFTQNIDHTFADDKILEQIRTGNTDAFELIYERYHQQLYRYIWTFLNFNTDEAGLVLSDVFIKTYTYIQKNKVDTLKSFLYRTAHNAAVDWIRTNQHQENIFPRDTQKYIDMDDQDQKQKLNTEHKQALIKQYLSQLDDTYRSVLYLIYYENKSYDEIALIQKSNKNSIGTLVFQAKKKLEGLMTADGIDPTIFF
ncbi:MAG: RNA polymerase sigma factor [candidate division SR1 bacterium]|nr:RNA polymerase sigma factor [candidate division SR1 bacterium]